VLLERSGGAALSRWLDSDCQRNLLRYGFLEPFARELIPNWKDRARRLLAEFRADFARTFREAQVRIFVETLRSESAFFAEAWDEQAVQTREGGLRVFNHPDDGAVSFIQHTFALAGLTTNLSSTRRLGPRADSVHDGLVIARRRKADVATRESRVRAAFPWIASP
jgi:MmyB-like transcription regulator ligand binding domain